MKLFIVFCCAMLATAAGYSITPPKSQAVQDLQQEPVIEEEKPTPRTEPTGDIQRLGGQTFPVSTKCITVLFAG